MAPGAGRPKVERTGESQTESHDARLAPVRDVWSPCGFRYLLQIAWVAGGDANRPRFGLYLLFGTHPGVGSNFPPTAPLDFLGATKTPPAAGFGGAPWSASRPG